MKCEGVRFPHYVGELVCTLELHLPGGCIVIRFLTVTMTPEMGPGAGGERMAATSGSATLVNPLRPRQPQQWDMPIMPLTS